MNIRPSAAIRQNYNEIADLCRETAEPIFLTKNGEGDLVVMDIETYNRHFHDAQCDQGGRRTWSSKINTA